MIKNISIEKIMFLDIETVPQADAWSSLDEQTQYLWDKKTKFQRKVAQAVKRARHLSLLPYVADLLK